MSTGVNVNPEKTLAALEPAALTEITEEAHARRRDHDLARALAAEPARGRARRRPMLLLATGLAAGAVAAGAVVVTGTGDAAPPAPGVSRSADAVDARSFLLASARTAEQAPDTTGAYYYTRMREQRMVRALVDKLSPGEQARKELRPTRKELPFTAFVTTTQDSWHGRSRAGRARTVTGLDREITFSTPADEAAWRKMGSPELEEWSARPQTNDYDFPAAELTPEQRRSEPGELAKLPTDEKALEKVLRGWHRATDRQAIRHDGVPTGTGFAEFVFYEAENLLSGAARPGTRAAFYRLLAAQPGIVMGGRVTDLLGRGGVALAYRSAAGEQRLIIDPATAALLGREAYQPLKRGRAPIRVLAQAMVIEGWVGDIGERP
ncbi:CU044_5270 family protein [Thermomonospora cellulosilytica]|uniref:Uncharacterized protein n=1 Tax=Thermomonospora cellulosilytica TaxID=1411118 RepID=A0A7W3N329_9ACTN|nr:CU044_5270 family protein [Thermomonospora cellulosilytica]MBA9006532.1 hypothetical protein [Thermomonospora cellulosilytica]